MRTIILCPFLLAFFASGCATQKPMKYVRIDGQRISDNPVLMQQVEVDRTICLGERQKAALSGVTVANGGIAGAVAEIERANAANQVANACMAQRGYLIVPEEQAEQKRLELLAITEQKKKQEEAEFAKQKRR